MRADIYLIITFDIVTDKYETLAELVQTLAAASKTEAGCLAYECSVNADRTKAYMVEHFESSVALVDHITHGFSQYVDAWNRVVSLSGLIAVGQVSDDLRRLLPAETVYADSIGGFTK